MTPGIAATAAGLVLWATGGGALAETKVVTVLDADLRGGYTRIRHGQGTSGAVGSVFVLPAIQFTGQRSLLPIYTFNGFLYDRLVEESALFQVRQVHAGSLGFKQGLSESFSAKLSFEGTYALNQETRDEKLGNGLYDYYDLGGRGALTYGRVQHGHRAPLSASFKVYQRRYPNFESLAAENQKFLIQEDPAAAAALATKEKKPKDYLAYELGSDATWWLTPRMRLNAGYSAALAFYEDRFLRTSQGEISDTKRLDHIHQLNGRLLVVHSRSWQYGVGIRNLFFASNDSRYDADQPVTPFMPRFYQHYSVAMTPFVTWVLPFERELKPRVRMSAGVLGRFFSHRLAQEGDGVFKNNKQHEQEYSLGLTGWYPLTKEFSLATGVYGRVARSNTRFEQFIPYNYELLTITGGITLSL